MKTIHASVAKGLAQASLRDLAELSAAALAEPVPDHHGSGRKLRASMLDDIAKKLKPFSFYLLRSSSPGYGGVLANVTLLPWQNERAVITSNVFYGRRSETAYLGEALGPALTVSRHAFERLHQRLGLATLPQLIGAIKQDIFRLLLLAWCAKKGEHEQPLSQLSMPLLGGAVRCDFSEEDDWLAIKTFVREPGTRETRLFKAVEDWLMPVEKALEDTLLLFPYYVHTSYEENANSAQRARAAEVLEGIRGAAWRVFKQHEWLWHPYEYREDPDAGAWSARPY